MKSRNYDLTIIPVVAPPGADVEFSVAHEMDIAPRAAFCAYRSSNASIYLGTTTWTSSLAYFKSDVGSVGYSVVFVR